MTEEPHGNVIFCDDIRKEMFGKHTFVGTYFDTLNAHGEFPFTLPKFGFVVRYYEPKSLPRIDVTLKILLPGDSLDAPTIVTDIPLSNEDLIKLSGDDPNKFRALQTQLVVAPLVLKTPGFIRVSMFREDAEIKLGVLQIIQKQADST